LAVEIPAFAREPSAAARGGSLGIEAPVR